MLREYKIWKCFVDRNYLVERLSKKMQLPELKSNASEATFESLNSILYRRIALITIGTAVDLEPYANLSTVFRVPAHRQEAQVFSSKGIVKDIPLHLIVVPVSRQCLRKRKEDHFYVYNKHILSINLQCLNNPGICD